MADRQKPPPPPVHPRPRGRGAPRRARTPPAPQGAPAPAPAAHLRALTNQEDADFRLFLDDRPNREIMDDDGTPHCACGARSADHRLGDVNDECITFHRTLFIDRIDKRDVPVAMLACKNCGVLVQSRRIGHHIKNLCPNRERRPQPAQPAPANPAVAAPAQPQVAQAPTRKDRIEELKEILEERKLTKEASARGDQLEENRIEIAQRKDFVDLDRTRKQLEEINREAQRSPSENLTGLSFVAPSLTPLPKNSYVPSFSLMGTGIAMSRLALGQIKPFEVPAFDWRSGIVPRFFASPPASRLSQSSWLGLRALSARLIRAWQLCNAKNIKYITLFLANLLIRVHNLLASRFSKFMSLGPLVFAVGLCGVIYIALYRSMWRHTVQVRVTGRTVQHNQDRRNDNHAFQQLTHPATCSQAVVVVGPHICTCKMPSIHNYLAFTNQNRENTRNVVLESTQQPCACYVRTRMIYPEHVSQVLPLLTRNNPVAYMASLISSGVRSQAGINYDRYQAIVHDTFNNTSDFLLNLYLSRASMNSGLNRTEDVVLGSSENLKLSDFGGGSVKTGLALNPWVL